MRIGVVGCGIAGQAVAIALARDGHDVTLVERFIEPKPLGAGLLLQPSGLTALERLGLREIVSRSGTPITRLLGRTVRGRTVMDLRYGDVADGAHGLGIHRSVLFEALHHALLADNIALRTGFEVRQIKNEDKPHLVARDGREEGPFDLVINCGGAHDTLRREFASEVRAPLYPWGALWATCIDRTHAFTNELRQIYDGAHTMIGILPVGHTPGAVGNSVSFFWSLRLQDHPALREAGLEALRARVVSAWPQARPIMDEIPDFDALSLATYRDVRIRPRFRGRVVTIGDAAHGTSPQLGQGANLALIDALVLAHALHNSADVPSALAWYVQNRKAHTYFYQLASRLLTPAFQSESRTIAWLRDLFFGPMGRTPGLKQAMRATLSGTRKFPFGNYRIPEDLQPPVAQSAQPSPGTAGR